MGSDFAAWLAGWFNSVLAWVVALLQSVFGGLWTMVTDLLLWGLDQLLNLVVYIVNGLTWNFSGFSPVQYWNALSPDLLNALNLLGVPIALGLIVAALTIRFILQIIPFVRWGS